MMNGRNNGKKLMAVRIVAHAFEIVRPQEDSDDYQRLEESQDLLFQMSKLFCRHSADFSRYHRSTS